MITVDVVCYKYKPLKKWRVTLENQSMQRQKDKVYQPWRFYQTGVLGL